MEMLTLFPRYVLKGHLPDGLLAELITLAGQVLADPESSPDASVKLAGQLDQQRQLAPQHPAVTSLASTVILPGCDHWIRHVMERQPPQGRGPWMPGRYGLQLVDVWLNAQRGGDYNPVHTHGGSFSGVVFLKVPPRSGPTASTVSSASTDRRTGTSRASTPAWCTTPTRYRVTSTCFPPGSPIRCRLSEVRECAGHWRST